MIAWLAAGLLACGSGESARPYAEPPAPRLVSLTPVVTETVAALGATDLLVGRSAWCTLPPEVTRLPAVGTSLTPDLERIAALRPTALLVDGSLATPVHTLRGLAPVEVLPWLTLSEAVASTRKLGQLVGRAGAADALAARLAALDVPAPAEGPVVLLTLTSDPSAGDLWFMKRNSLHGSLLHAAGARNAVDRDVEGAPTLSVEGVIALDPSVIVVLTPEPVDEGRRSEIVEAWGRLTVLTAVREGRVGVLGGPELLSVGPSVLGTVDRLRDELARVRAP